VNIVKCELALLFTRAVFPNPRPRTRLSPRKALDESASARAKTLALMPSNNTFFKINFIWSTFLFVQRFKCTQPAWRIEKFYCSTWHLYLWGSVVGSLSGKLLSTVHQCSSAGFPRNPRVPQNMQCGSVSFKGSVRVTRFSGEMIFCFSMLMRHYDFFRSTCLIQTPSGPVSYRGGWVHIQKKKYWQLLRHLFIVVQLRRTSLLHHSCTTLPMCSSQKSGLSRKYI